MDKKLFSIFIFIIGIITSFPAYAVGKINFELQTILDYNKSTDLVDIIVDLSNGIDYKRTKYKGKHNRENLIRTSKSKFSLIQQKLVQYLVINNITEYRKLWMINALAVTVESRMIPEIVALVGVSNIRYDKKIKINAVSSGNPGTPEWNINQIKAPELWSLGFTGQNVVIGILDTGVDMQHPDLISRYRGGTNSWFDPYDKTGTSTPYDLQGHGTSVMSIIVGGNNSGTAIGIAPDAKWIAAKIFDDAGSVTYSAVHAAFQWMIDPNGDGVTDDAADVVNNSWNFDTILSNCDYEFQNDINALKAADITVVFSSGNLQPLTGLTDGSSLSPANNANIVSVGSVDETLSIEASSSRGPTPCGTGIYPKIVAPGTGIYTADLSSGGNSNYKYKSGTSFAAPHIAGALALLQSALPISKAIEREDALRLSVVDLGNSGDDTTFGWGFLNIDGAYRTLLAGNQVITLDPVANNEIQNLYRNASATSFNILSNDSPDTRVDASNEIDPTSITIISAPSQNTGSINVNTTSGIITYTPVNNVSGIDSFSYTVKDTLGNVSNVGTVSINISKNEAPVPGSSDGGCTLQATSRFDPILIILIFLSLSYFIYRASINLQQRHIREVCFQIFKTENTN